MDDDGPDNSIHTDGYYYGRVSELDPGNGREFSRWKAERRLEGDELAEIYEGDSIARRIVDRIVDDATRADWDLVGLDEAYDWPGIKSQADDLAVLTHIADAWKWSRLQGGSILVLAVDDGRRYDEPLDLRAAKALRGLSTLDSTQIRPSGVDVWRGTESIRNPPHYELIGNLATGAVQKIHSSRVVRFDGVRVPTIRLARTDGWGPSILQGCYRALAAYENAMASAAAMLRRLSVLNLKINGWKKTKGADEEQQTRLRDGIRDMWRALTNFNLLVLDAEDELVEIKRSVEGLDKLIDKFLDDLVACADGCTRQIITGTQTSTGLNSDTKGEWRAWYDRVTVERRVIVEPALNRVLEVIFACRRNAGEQVPTGWTIEWSPLEQEAQPDVADRAATWSTALSTMIATKMIGPHEGRQVLIDQGILDATELAAANKAAALTEGTPAEGVEPVQIAPAEEPEGDVQDQALNGAQVQALQALLQGVAEGILPPEAAQWLITLAVPGLDIAGLGTAVAAAAAMAKSRPAIAPSTITTQGPQP